MSDNSQRVAIVGIGGLFPGAPDPDAFWSLVASGTDATGEVPPDRWLLDPATAYDSRVGEADRVYSTRGGFVTDFRLDPEGLDLDPALVARLDPMFHLALHAGRAAWRDARTDELDRARVGVVFGNIVLPTETTSALTRETLGRALEERVLGGRTERPREHDLTDPINRFAAGLPAGLLARALGLGGGACTLDAACASSLYALELAADALRAGRVDAMITGGLSRPDPLYTQMGFSQLRALSAEGVARPFDGRGEGLVVGEGCGMFVLKRLDDALRQGDHIYGIVAGVGLSNDVDGGLLAPSSEGQLRAMRSAYEQAGWGPSDVDLIECHATGTPVGDAVEFESLKALWSNDSGPPGRCVIGSHKANIGHTLTASGSAGLLKLLLALKHRTLPPTANFSAAGTKIDLASSPFRMLTVAEPWAERGAGVPRRAAISGFGFGGINAHVLIEEWIGRESTRAVMETRSPGPVAIVGMGARIGTFRGLRAVQERVLGGHTEAVATRPCNDWGLFEREHGQEPVAGHHIDALELPLDRFRIPPKELEEMLPQQSLALLVAAEALADAGQEGNPSRLRTGVFIGIALDPNTTNFHVRWSVDASAPEWERTLGLHLDDAGRARWIDGLKAAAGPHLTANRTMGALGGLIASRIAREFRIGGPSFSVSSEETSGLKALEVAVRLLQRGELDAAVVGAVDLTGDPRIALAGGRAGTAPLPRGDAAVALVLKRLDDAVRDGDRVHAVVTDIESRSGGEVSSIERLEPADSFGHTGAAHALVRLLTTVIPLYQQILPPPEGPCFWIRNREEGPRRSITETRGVDGGSVRVALAEFEGTGSPRVVAERAQPLGTRAHAVFAVEADDASGLLRRLDQLDALAAASDGPIELLARRWWADSPADPARAIGLGIVARSLSDLRTQLAAVRTQVEAGDGPALRDRCGQVAFVYPGIGNPFHDVGLALSSLWPEVFRAIDAGTLRMRSQLEQSDWFAAGPTPYDDHRHPILGQIVMGMAVTDLLARFGVRPEAVIGYSLGESAALFATHAWADRDEMHRRLEASPLFQTELAGPCNAARRVWKLADDEPVDWAAAIVAAPVGDVRAAIAMTRLDRVYAIIVNTPAETVVGGRRDQLAQLIATLDCLALPLPVVSTVHCPIARDVEPAYRALHELDTTPAAGVRYYSAVWGRSYVPDRATAADAIVGQAVDTVDFPAVVNQAYEDGVRVFIEVGPGSSCTRLIRAILGNRPCFARPACVAGDDALVTILDLLARLIRERVPVDLRPLYGEPTCALGLVEETTRSPRRTLVVTIGGRPFDVPPPPEPALPPPITEERPTVSRMPVLVPSAASASIGASSNPLTAQLLATGAATGEAHATFLRFSARLGETMASQVAYQMSLIEALASTPGAMVAPQGAAPPAVEVAPEEARRRPVLDRDQCLEFAVGSIGKVLGESFAAVDAYPTRVRLPDEPLMLVDRITLIEGEPHTLTSGRVVTEHDVLPGDWYLDGGKTPPCISIESGQADLFLSAWLGIDTRTKGLAVYRLLDAAVTFHRELPVPGEVIRYDIRILRFFRQGETILFRFEFDGAIDGTPLLTMRDGCAGFFSAEELAAGQGIVRRPLDLRPLPGKRPDDWSVLVPLALESYDDAQVEALRRGDFAAAFGPAFAGLGLVDPLRLPGGRLSLVNRIPVLDPTGGRYGLGLIRSELDIHPDDWFLTCHFVDDQVMPGTLMYECCLHALRVYLLRMGWVSEAAGIAYEPVPGVSSRLRCRGQVIATTRQAVFEVVLKELGYGPEPYAIADAMMYADGKAVVEVVDMTLRLTGLSRECVEATWKRAAGPASPVASRPVEPSNTLVFTREQVLAFATGNPSDAFGEAYRPFDRDRFVARLPAPPYSFLDRVVSTTCQPLLMKPGGEAESHYDVPADAWYFEAERTGVMPFAVLQEIPLQACGWMAAFMGSALTSDEDLAFRNLGGEAVVLADVTPATGTLTTRVKVTKISHSGGMILQHYDFQTSAGSTPVYRGSTYFGFFRREALADQVGIREASPYQPIAEELARVSSMPYPAEQPFPGGMLRMIDRVEAFIPDGGPHGLGYIAGSLDVDPTAWFFKAHFHGDPVCPGSLGLESLLQLLKVVAAAQWPTDAGRTAAGFEPVAHGATHRWLYRGQVVPADRAVNVQAVVTAIDDARRQVTADGFLSVDGRLIYQMNGFSLRLRTRG